MIHHCVCDFVVSTLTNQDMSTPLFLVFLLLWPLTTFHVSASRHDPKDLVRSSCSHASYPNLCLRTLSSYSGPDCTPKDLAQAAVKVSLTRARRVSAYLKNQASSDCPVGKRKRGALGDCIEQMADSIDDLSKTLDELQHLRGTPTTFRWHLSNAKTWVSAALTNHDTCLDGFGEDDGVGKLKTDVSRKVRNVARVTSNALYMIDRLDDTRGRPRSKL